MPDPFRLPRIKTLDRIVDALGRPTVQFVKFFNTDFAATIERQEAAQAETDEAIQAVQDEQAVIIADLQAEVDRLTDVLAGITPFTGLNVGGTNVKPLLDRSDGSRFTDVTALPANQNTSLGLRSGLTIVLSVVGGVSATATVSAHSFQLGGEVISLDGGAVTGLALTTNYYLYYDDPTYAGGAVTYLATTDPTVITASTGRFSVGFILTPDAGGSGGTEDPSGPPWWKFE